MHVGESVRMALGSIRANKLRAGLTLLSIAIGVLAIVGVSGAVGALENQVADQLVALGRTSFRISKMPAASFGGGGRWEYRNRKDITLRQALDFKERMTSAENVGISSQTSGSRIRYEGISTDPDVTVYGADESFTVNFDYPVAEGRAIDPRDVQFRDEVAVIGAEVAADLFPRTSPIGQPIQIDGHRYVVVGVFEKKGAVFGESQDNMVAVPITSAAKFFFSRWESSFTLTVRAHSVETLQNTVDQAIGLLRILRRVELGKPNDFEIITNESLSDTFGGFTDYITWFGLACGAIALLAASVGIMNIMLVSVKERTREIGVRKAVGATGGDIMTQFLIEAITLCQFGGIAGVLLGFLAAFGISSGIGVTPAIPYEWAVVALAICLFVGVISGLYPAWKASRLDPIESLRYE